MSRVELRQEAIKKDHVLLSNAIREALMADRQYPPGKFGNTLRRLQAHYRAILGDPEQVKDPTKLTPAERQSILTEAEEQLCRADRRVLGARGYLYGRGQLAPSIKTRNA